MHNEFKKARIRLTVYYSLVSMLILFLFSVLVYGLFIQRFPLDRDRFTHHDRVEEDVEMLIRQEAVHQFISVQIISDSILFGVIVISSYLFASYTLGPIEKAYMTQKRFIADAAHELRTPLAVMKAGTELLMEKKELSEKVISIVRDQKGEIDYMSSMINDLLFLAKTDSQKQSVREDILLSDIVSKQSDLLSQYAKTKDVLLEHTIEKNITVKGNAIELKMLSANLIKNAIDYNVKGGTVKVRLVKDKNKIMFSVADTGVGIDKDKLPFIFDRFYKADAAREVKEGGAGLGLSIVKEIIRRHDAQIVAESEKGKGTIIKAYFS